MKKTSSSKNSLKEIEKTVNKYSIYLKKSVKDWKQRNHPLDKKYHHKPDLRWFPYRKWYHASIGEKKIIESVDWSQFTYAVYHQLKNEKSFDNFSKKIQKLTKNKNKSLFENWMLKSLFIFFNEEEDDFFTRKKLVKYLIRAIKNELPVVKTKSLLSGVLLEIDEIIINKDLKIRKATKQDLEFLLDVGEKEYDYDRVVEDSFCVLEYTYKKENEYVHSFDMLKRIEVIFQLFKLSSVHSTGTVERSSEISSFHHGVYQGGFYSHRGVVYYSKIKDDEIEYLKRFYKIMQKRLTRRMIDHYFEDDEKVIALSRYSKGLDWIHNVESSVSYAVMAIEALLIKSEGDQKLRFALRTSKLLSMIGLNMKQVYENLMIAYDVRSKYVHGDKMSKRTSNVINKKFKNKEKFAFIIMDYARLIIVNYLILNKSKDEFYQMLENSQFPKGEITLKNELKPFFKYLKMTKYKPRFRIYEVHNAHYITE